jgi:AcrR family transcriptional regulator
MTKKKKILREAARLFAEKGFNSTTTAEIAEAAETAHGTIFYHYQSKFDMIKSIYDDLVVEFWENLNSAISDERNGLENVKSLLKNALKFAEEHKNENTVLHRDLPQHILHDKEWLETISENNRKIIETMKNVIENGIEDGSIRKEVNSEQYATLMRAMVIGVIKMKYAKSFEVDVTTDSIQDFCVNALEKKD